MTAALEARGLTKSFGTRRVLWDVSFRLNSGSICCLAGANGSGKTTLLKILAALILPDAGTATLLGRPLRTSEGWIRARSGYHDGERPSLYARLTCRENLRFFGALHSLPAERLEYRITELSSALGFVGELDRRFQELSSGLKQRVLLARTLLHDPALLLLDEPTRGLDPEAAERFLAETLPIARAGGKTVLMATHRIAETAASADAYLLLSQGRLERVSGGAEEVLEKLKRKGRPEL